MSIQEISLFDGAVNFAIGTVGSFIASSAFIFSVFKWGRPNIVISENIAKSIDNFDPDKRTCFMFKIINKSKYNAYDIKLEVNKVISIHAVNGSHKRLIQIDLMVPYLESLSGYEKKWKKLQTSDFAASFRTFENLTEILANELNAIEIQVTLKHQITGLSKVFYHKFVNKSCIKDGTFHAGNDTSVSA